jgi:alpha-1,2-mannosyltransferase
MASRPENPTDDPVNGLPDNSEIEVSLSSSNSGSSGAFARAVTRRNVVAVCLGLLVVCYAAVLTSYLWPPGPHHMDFFGIWSWARFEIERPPALIYDHAAQQAFLLALDPKFPVPMPFPYPPPYLLVIRPLGWMSYPLAQALWSGTTLAAYLAALWDRPPRSSTLLLALLAPAAAVNLFYGQNGFLTAALLMGGIRLAPSRPVLGGILLGLLLSYKPQFGLLAVIALAASELWCAALAGALTVAAAAIASLLAFGAEPWSAWIGSLPEFGTIVYEQRARLVALMPTAFSNALALGASERSALLIQTAVAFVAAAAVWFAFRSTRGKPAAAALAVASVLASPYAFIYDLTLVAAAAALIAGEAAATLGPTEVLVLAAALLLPAGMFLNVVPPVATLVHLAVLAVILLHLRSAAPGRTGEPAGLPTKSSG